MQIRTHAIFDVRIGDEAVRHDSHGESRPTENEGQYYQEQHPDNLFSLRQLAQLDGTVGLQAVFLLELYENKITRQKIDAEST